jgi:Flp pilus assembly protein TadB
MRAVHELGESKDPRAAHHLVTALRDEDSAVSVEVVLMLERRRDQVAILPMYELVQEEDAEPITRHAAAEALVTLGLLRRPRVGPSRQFLWLIGLTLVIVAAGAADIIGVAGAIVLFAVGAAVLVVYSRRASRKEREGGSYIGPDRATIHIPAIQRPAD